MKLDSAKTSQIAEYRHDAPLLCCEFDPLGRFVFAGGRDSSVVCFDIAAEKCTLLAGHESWVGSLARSGPNLVLTADYAGRVIAWDCSGESPKLQWSIAAHANTIQSLSASADGQLFATGDRDGTIRIWRASDGHRTHEIVGLGYPVTALAFHPDGVRLASADRQPRKPRLKIWDFATGQELKNIDVPQLSAYRRVEDIEWGGIRGITMSPDGQTLVACGSNEYAGPACALLFDLQTGELKQKLASTLKGFYYGAMFHPHGFLLTVSGDVAKGEFCAWDQDKGELLAAVATPGPCTAIDIHPDGSCFAITQTIGKGSYPDSGTLTLFEWSN